MTTEVYYFSGTGNSLHVARELQKRIPEVQLIPIVSLAHRQAVETHAEAVGFVFPQYAGTMPGVVARTVERLDLGSAHYLFAIATRGGTTCRAFADMDRLLARAGRRLDAYCVVTMPSGSAPLVETYADNITEERVARLERDMLHRLDAMQAAIAARAVSRQEDLSGEDVPPPDILKPFLPVLKLIEPILLPLGRLAERSFTFYCDIKCTGCGICEQVCLAQRVRMADGRPTWQEEVQCYGCFACLNFCPQQSVQVRSTWYLKSYTETNGRYHHPQITAIDIAGQKTGA